MCTFKFKFTATKCIQIKSRSTASSVEKQELQMPAPQDCTTLSYKTETEWATSKWEGSRWSTEDKVEGLVTVCLSSRLMHEGTVMSRAQNDTVANTIGWHASYALVPWFPIGAGGYWWVLRVTDDDWWIPTRMRSGDSGRPSLMNGAREVVGGVGGETREGLHKNGTGRQLDFSSEYCWAIYTTTRRITEVYARPWGVHAVSNRNEVSGNKVNTKE